MPDIKPIKKQSIINEKWLEEITSIRDMILGTLVLVSQIPAETFHEKKRAEFVKQRLDGIGSLETFNDDSGNVIAIRKGLNSKYRIVISASMDTHFGSDVDHNVSVSMDRASGAGVENNSMGLTALLSIPDILDRLEIKHESDLIFVATTKSLGKGDIEGMRHFFKTFPFTTDFVINLAGTSLGRIDHFSHGAVRCDVSCMIERNGDSSNDYGFNNAILVLNELINSLLRIPITIRPKTRLNIGMIHAGESYSSPCPAASLHLYVNSEDDSIIDNMINSIKDCCMDVSSSSGAKLDVSFFGRQRATGLRFSHPLVRRASQVAEALGFQPKVEPTNTQITMPLSRNIPSVTIGITTGKRSLLPDGYVDLEHIPKGLVQVLTLIDSIDKGLCND